MLLLFDLRSLKLKLGIVLVSQLVVIVFRHKIYIEYLELVYLVLILLISSGFFCVCVCGIPHKVSLSSISLFIYSFIYLFICLQEWSAGNVVSSLDVSTWEALVPVYCVPFMFRGRPFLFSAVGVLLILKFLRVVLLVHMVSWSRFPFWRFRWVHLSLNFLYKLTFWLQNIAIDRRKPITFAFFVVTRVVCNLRPFFRYSLRCF